MLGTGDPSENMDHKPKPIRELSLKYEKLSTLINRVDLVHLWQAHDEQSQRKAPGVDKITKDLYTEHLMSNLENLVDRMKRFEYIPQPVKRVYIPKPNGKLRPLGLPAYEDRLVQKVMADILIELYDPRFLDCSYGFRPGRSAHDVIRYIDSTVMHKGVNYVLEADIKGFFDNLDQGWLMKFLQHDISDKNFLRYIKRFLKAGIMEEGQILESDRGAPQGGLISPILSNVYLHYVLDLWVEKVVKKRAKGRVYYCRFADDFLLMTNRKDDAENIMEWLKDRFKQFGLELAEDKTRILPFGRFSKTKDKFDFLGFTFVNGKTRKGSYKVAIISSKKKLKTKRLAVKEWLKKRINQPMVVTLKLLNLKLQGHYNYYGINGNIRSIMNFMWYVYRTTLWILRRRGQKRPITVQRFAELWNRFVKPARITKSIWQY